MADKMTSSNNGSQELTHQTPGQGSKDSPSSSSSSRMRPGDQLAAINDLLRKPPEEDPSGDDRGDAARGDDASESEGGGTQGEDPKDANAGDEGEAQGGGEAPGEAPEGEGGDGLTLKALAEKLDVPLEDLYSLKLTTGDGDEVTVGDLKDAYQNQGEAARESDRRSANLDEREAALTSDIQQLAILDVMRAVPPQQRAQAAQHLKTMAEREYSDFVSLTPGMDTDENRIAFDKESRILLGKYGVIPEQLGVRTVGMLRLMRDVLRDRKALADLRKPKAKPAPQSQKARKAAAKTSAQRMVEQAKASGSKTDETRAIAALLKG